MKDPCWETCSRSLSRLESKYETGSKFFWLNWGCWQLPYSKSTYLVRSFFHWNHYTSDLSNLDFLKSTPAPIKIIQGFVFTIPSAEHNQAMVKRSSVGNTDADLVIWRHTSWFSICYSFGLVMSFQSFSIISLPRN